MEKLGAATGGVVASGVGLIGQVAGNAIAGGAQEAVGNRHGASFKSVIAATTVGAIAGRAGGAGVGNTVKKCTSQPVKKFVREIKYKRSIKSAKAEFKQSFKQSKTHTRYLFNRKSNYKFWKGIKYSNSVNILYSWGNSGYKRSSR